MCLGAALGGLVGLVLATTDEGLFQDATYVGVLLAAWVIAWVIVGFAILPYLTIVPATWLIERVEDLSTAEFITAVIGLLRRPAHGAAARLPVVRVPTAVRVACCRSASRCSSASGCSDSPSPNGRTSWVAAEAVGLLRPPDPVSAIGPAQRANRASSSTPRRSSTAGSQRSSKSGFIYGTLVIPRFVLDELQHIADSSDTLRRNRGRRGLEILARMQKEPGTPVEIVEDAVPSRPRWTPSSSRWHSPGAG